MIDIKAEIDRFIQDLQEDAKGELRTKGNLIGKVYFLLFYEKDNDRLASIPVPVEHYMQPGLTQYLPARIQHAYDELMKIGKNGKFPSKLLAVVLLSDTYYVSENGPASEIQPMDNPNRREAIWIAVHTKDATRNVFHCYERRDREIIFKNVAISNIPIKSGHLKSLFPKTE